MTAAREMVGLAGPQGPLVGMPQRLAFDARSGESSRPGTLHEGVSADQILNALKDTRCVPHPALTSPSPNSTRIPSSPPCGRYMGPGLVLLPDMWQHVVALAAMPEGTVASEEPSLKPLVALLEPIARHSPISACFVEQSIKKLKRSLSSSQRRSTATATLNVAAVSRNPEKLYLPTDAEDRQASVALGHNKSSRVKPRALAPEVADGGAGLGVQAEDEAWGGDEEEEEDDDDFESEEEEEEKEEEEEQEQEDEELQAGEVIERTSGSIREQLLVGSIVSATHPECARRSCRDCAQS